MTAILVRQRTKKQHRDACVIDATAQVCRCTVCGEEIPIPLGCVEWVMGVMKCFTSIHKHCQPQLVASGHSVRCTYFAKPVDQRKGGRR